MTASAQGRVCATPVFVAIPLALLALSASAQEAPDTAQSAFEAYVADRGSDFDACFQDFPDLTDTVGIALAPGEDDAAPVEPRSVVLALDASGSMAGTVSGETKMEAARDAAETFLSSLPDDIAVGLVLFGHEGNNQEDGRAQSCAGVETAFALTDSDRDGIAETLSGVEATGWTPLAAAITEAAAGFTPSEVAGEQVVYVISDGEETCDGDPVDAARALAESDIRAVVNIIGFDLPQADRAQLMAVAEAGNGAFFEAASGSDLRNHFADAGRNVANATAMAQTRIGAGTGQAHNTINTETMINQSGICLGTASAREMIGVPTWLSQNDIDRSFGSEISALLRERHAEYRALHEDLAAKARARMDDANTSLQDDLDSAEDAFNALDTD